jgi:hypothetical protein
MNRKKETSGKVELEKVIESLDLECLGLGVLLEELESSLVAFECAAQFTHDNPNYDQPDLVLVFRILRRQQAALQEKVSGLINRVIIEEKVA